MLRNLWDVVPVSELGQDEGGSTTEDVSAGNAAGKQHVADPQPNIPVSVDQDGKEERKEGNRRRRVKKALQRNELAARMRVFRRGTFRIRSLRKWMCMHNHLPRGIEMCM